MTNQYHDVRINLTLTHVDGTKDVKMVRGVLLPFVPREGDTIRLYEENNDNIWEVTASSVAFDMRDRCFDIYVEDTSIQDGYRAGERPTMDILIESYKAYGFTRTEYPVVQIK